MSLDGVYDEIRAQPCAVSKVAELGDRIIMIKLRHTPPAVIPLAILALLAIMYGVTGGAASAQDRGNFDEIVSSAQGLALQLGGFLRPGDTLRGILPRPGDVDKYADGWVAYLIYFGNRSDISLDKSYTIDVKSDFALPKITVITYYDAAKLEHYAHYFGYDLDSFVRDLGMKRKDDQISTVPIGTVVAGNKARTRSLTFRPVAGDIGAYLILVSSFADDTYGSYAIRISA